jgi:nucleoside-diphosphate-sugar epimerase
MRVSNIEGTANVVNACSVADVPLIYVSSVAALGRTSAEQSLDESCVWKDSPYNSNYAISKYHAEMEVWRGVEEGLDAVIINPTIILGAGKESRSSGTIFGAVNQGLKFYTDGGASVVDVRDVSEIALRLWKRKDLYSHRFVLNSASIPYRSLFDEVADSLNKSRPSIHVGGSMLSFAWRLFALKDVLLRTKSSLTKESAHSSTSSYIYSSKKVSSALDFEFIDWKDSVKFFSEFYS